MQTPTQISQTKIAQTEETQRVQALEFQREIAAQLSQYNEQTAQLITEQRQLNTNLQRALQLTRTGTGSGS